MNICKCSKNSKFPERCIRIHAHSIKNHQKNSSLFIGKMYPLTNSMDYL